MEKSSNKKSDLTEAVLPGRIEPGLLPVPRPWGFIVQVAVIVAVTWWIYWPALRGDWLWDDDVYITSNFFLHSFSGLWETWSQASGMHEYYPITGTVQWLQWQLFGTTSLGYHLTNVVLHMANALLVWRLLDKFRLRLAWLGGVLFAIHPMMVESVAWIAELKNTLSLTVFLFAMICWIDYTERHERRDYLLALGLFLMAMLCKTSMAGFPFVILLYAWWKQGRIEWADLKRSAPFFGVSLLLGLVGVLILHYLGNTNALTPVGGIGARLAISGLLLAFFFGKPFLPLGLATIYPRWSVDPPSLIQFLPWLVVGLVFFYLWTKRSTWGTDALLGLGFFLLMIAPVLGLAVASYSSMTWSLDHLDYIPMIGLIGLVVATLGHLAQQISLGLRLCGAGVVILAIVWLAEESHNYAFRYIDQETLWTQAIRQNPGAWTAYNNLGNDLYQKGHIPEAMALFDQSLKIHPQDAYAHNNLGNALMHSGQMAKAINELKLALKVNPNFALAHNNLGYAYLQTGHLPEAIEELELALKFNPYYVDAHNNLGNAFLQTGRLAEAMEQCQLAVQLDPGLAEAHSNWGVALLETRDVPEAVEQFEQAIAIKPDYVAGHFNLGVALLQAGRIPEGAQQLELALKLQPDLVAAKNILVQLQAKPKPSPSAGDGSSPSK